MSGRLRNQRRDVHMRLMRTAGRSPSTVARPDQSFLALMLALMVAFLVSRMVFVSDSASLGYALDALLLVAVTGLYNRARQRGMAPDHQ